MGWFHRITLSKTGWVKTAGDNFGVIMINTSKLLNARMDTSKNDWLQSIWGLSNVYNGLPQSNKNELVTVLDRLFCYVAEWITSHPPKTTATNTARWDAMNDLANQLAAESERLGVRFLSGPTEWKKIGNPARFDTTLNKHVSTGKKRSYWLERIDAGHRAGFDLSSRFELWLTSGAPDESFWQFVGMPAPWTRNQVKYFGDTAKALKRRVSFEGNGKLHDSRGNLFHTQPLKTLFSGAGWCIFVVDMDGNLYAHKHVEGEYHHSTFLSGAPVQAAGEMVIDQGQVKVITAKSGHYMPTVQQMVRLLSLFPEIPGQALIAPDFSSSVPKWHRVSQFRFEGSKAPALKRGQVVANLPLWAQSNEAMVTINKIPA